MGKKGGKKNRKDDNWEDEAEQEYALEIPPEEEEEPVMAAKKGKKGKKGKRASAVEEEDGPQGTPEPEAEPEPEDDIVASFGGKSKKGKKGKKGKKQQDEWPEDPEEADPVLEPEPEPEPEPEVAPVAAKKKGKKGKKGKKQKDEWGSEPEEEVEQPAEPVPEEEEDASAGPASKKSGKKGKKNQQQEADVDAAAAELDALEIDAEAEPEAEPEPEPEAEPEPEEATAAEAESEAKPEEAEPAASKDKRDETPEERRARRAKRKAEKAAKLAKQGLAPDGEGAATAGSERKSKEKKASKRELRKQKAKEAYDEEQKAMGLASNFTLAQRSTNKEIAENSKDIVIDAFSIAARGKDLFVNAELKITYGRRYGLIGPNGHGKTTLLRHIAERKLNFPANIDCLLCEQEVAADNVSAADAVLASFTRRTELLNEVKELEAKIEDDKTDKTQKLLEAAYTELDAIGADAAAGKARRILAGLGFTTEMQNRATKNFSGGWRMRVSLAKALFIEPTLLLLDEPTNHLDLNAVIWLDNYLSTWKKTILIVSHDQDFLDNVCTDIVHLDMKKLKYYRGNYSLFKKAYKQRRREEEKAYEKQRKELKRAKQGGTSKAKAEAAALSRQKRGKDKGKGKGKDDAIDEGPVQLLERPKEYIVNFTFPNPPELAPPILGLHDASFQYSAESDVLFDHLEIGLDMSSRIAIVGNNGVGKSTLLKLLDGTIQPTKGRVTRNHRLRMGVYNQHSSDQLGAEESPAEYLRRLFDIDLQNARKTLGRFGLEGHAHTIKMKDLSGGQKARVVFAELAMRAPDILILDEPTNNLDIESIDALVDAINEYEGGVIIVSHDARLILDTECQLFECANRNCIEIDGDFNDYRELVLERLEEDIEEVEGRRVGNVEEKKKDVKRVLLSL